MDRLQLLLPVAMHAGFALVGGVATRRVWEASLRRAAGAAVAVLLGLGAQCIGLATLGALTWSEGLDLRNAGLLLVVAGSLAGSGWLAFTLEIARNTMLRGGGELTARWSAFWLLRLVFPVELGTIGAALLSRIEGLARVAMPIAIFALVLSFGAVVTATLLKRAARHIARR